MIYKRTGLFIDWNQLESLPEIDTLIDIDIGIGTRGTPELYELNIINGATNTQKETEFVIAEVRHNYESYKNGYKLEEFMLAMHNNDFILTNIYTAKPLIADLCFQPKSNLIK